MRIEKKVTVDAPRHLVWDHVTEPANYCVFLEGLTRWDVEGDKHKGLGARYRMLLRVGAADVGGLIEVVEWQPEGDMAWSSVTGVDQRGRWRLREAGGDDRRAGRLQVPEPPVRADAPHHQAGGRVAERVGGGRLEGSQPPAADIAGTGRLGWRRLWEPPGLLRFA